MDKQTERNKEEKIGSKLEEWTKETKIERAVGRHSKVDRSAAYGTKGPGGGNFL